MLQLGEGRRLSDTACSYLMKVQSDINAVLDAHSFRKGFASRGFEIDYVGASEGFRSLDERVKRLAAERDVPVLVTGERGSGKESAACALHYYSPRRNGPFLPLNSACLQRDLYESELFGHRRGAFTGAQNDRPGKFREAAGGTIFFDEITAVPREVCPGLLRALDHGEIQTIGYDRPTRVNVRIVAATNKDINRMVKENQFPADLYDRLNVLSIRVPSLRERKKDVTQLLKYFFRRFCPQGKASGGPEMCRVCRKEATLDCLTPQLLQLLEGYDWPGNIRELRNVAIQLLAESAGTGGISKDHLPTEIRRGRTACQTSDSNLELKNTVKGHILTVLGMTKGNKSAAAKLLGLPLSTLVSKMKRLGIGRIPERVPTEGMK
jgi:DNA-binding NtrC family response regulator